MILLCNNAAPNSVFAASPQAQSYTEKSSNSTRLPDAGDHDSGCLSVQREGVESIVDSMALCVARHVP
jgi:hypothetical protein